MLNVQYPYTKQVGFHMKTIKYKKISYNKLCCVKIFVLHENFEINMDGIWYESLLFLVFCKYELLYKAIQIVKFVSYPQRYYPYIKSVCYCIDVSVY